MFHPVSDDGIYLRVYDRPWSYRPCCGDPYVPIPPAIPRAPRRRAIPSIASVIASDAIRHGATGVVLPSGEAVEPDEGPLTTAEVVREVGPPKRKKHTPAQAVASAERTLAGWVAKRDAAQRKVTHWRKELRRRRKRAERAKGGPDA